MEEKIDLGERRIRTSLMFLYTVLTYYIYYVFWLKNRRHIFDGMAGKEVVSNKYLIIIVVLLVLGNLLSFYPILAYLLLIPGFVMLEVMIFRLKNVLIKYAESKGISDFKVSDLALFVFTFLSVNYYMNKLADALSQEAQKQVVNGDQAEIPE